MIIGGRSSSDTSDVRGEVVAVGEELCQTHPESVMPQRDSRVAIT